MKEERIVLNERYPQLAAAGIPHFGYYQKKSPSDRLGVHQHGSCYEICFLESGVQPYFISPGQSSDPEEAVSYEMHGGDIFIVSPYQLHSTGPYFQQRGCLYWIQIDIDCPQLFNLSPEGVKLIKQALGRIDRHLMSIPHTTAAKLTDAFHLLMELSEEKMLRACSLLTLFVLELADRSDQLTVESAPATAPSGKLSDAVTFIRNNLTAPSLSLDTVAKHLHYSKSYTSALFKREYGVTIHEFILRSKIDLACELLPGHSIIDVSNLLSFSSSQHFSKVFKEQKGIPPSVYIRMKEQGLSLPDN